MPNLVVTSVLKYMTKGNAYLAGRVSQVNVMFNQNSHNGTTLLFFVISVKKKKNTPVLRLKLHTWFLCQKKSVKTSNILSQFHNTASDIDVIFVYALQSSIRSVNIC